MLKFIKLARDDWKNLQQVQNGLQPHPFVCAREVIMCGYFKFYNEKKLFFVCGYLYSHLFGN